MFIPCKLVMNVQLIDLTIITTKLSLIYFNSHCSRLHCLSQRISVGFDIFSCCVSQIPQLQISQLQWICVIPNQIPIHQPACWKQSSSVCVCRSAENLTTPKLKTSDFGVISPLSASGAMYAQVPTILSVIMVVDVRLADALVSPKSEIFATNCSSKRIFALTKTKGEIR